MPLSITAYNREHADPKRSAAALAGASKRIMRQNHRTGAIRWLQKQGIDATEARILQELQSPNHRTCCWGSTHVPAPTTLLEQFS